MIIWLIEMPSKIRQKRAEEEHRYMSEKSHEIEESLEELEKQSKEAKEKLMKELEIIDGLD